MSLGGVKMIYADTFNPNSKKWIEGFKKDEIKEELENEAPDDYYEVDE
jgi:siroheme synthase (precorrin-2 oxidase/ferrochelatase)